MERIEFKLDKGIVEKYRGVQPSFGFNGLGEFTYARTYSRLLPNGQKESWVDTVERVVNGTYTLQKRHIHREGLGWDEEKGQESAAEMFDRIFHMKFLPPGRGLWAMGTPIVEVRGSAALQNCGATTTANIARNLAEPFCFMMDATMLGVGVGFDVDGAEQVRIQKPTGSSTKFVIPDSREGWVESLRRLLLSYQHGVFAPEFDYSQIRPAGAPIRTFGGVASGPGPLIDLHEDIRTVLDPLDGQPITARAIVDIMNLIGRCVVAGSVRRSAQIAFGPDVPDYLDLKNYDVNPERAAWGWASNNSIRAKLGQSYYETAQRIQKNGEPGLAWFENIRDYGRMNGDASEVGTDRAVLMNPCAEQPLESGELCCLVETFPARHSNLADYKRTLKFAYLYAKTVTLLGTHWVHSNRVMMRNRRIGLSMSGIAQFIAARGVHELKKWADEGYTTVRYYDDVYSDWFGIKNSIRVTTVKPSGTVSLLAGATPGVHYPESRFYIRRVRIRSDDPLAQEAIAAGYHVEPAVYEPDTLIVEFPVDAGVGVRPASEVSMWEQLALAALMQKHWSDNAVSCTVSFSPTEGRDIESALEFYQYALKAVSFLPRTEKGAYQQMPYEAISEARYAELVGAIRPVTWGGQKDSSGEKYCDTDVCAI